MTNTYEVMFVANGRINFRSFLHHEGTSFKCSNVSPALLEGNMTLFVDELGVLNLVQFHEENKKEAGKIFRFENSDAVIKAVTVQANLKAKGITTVFMLVRNGVYNWQVLSFDADFKLVAHELSRGTFKLNETYINNITNYSKLDHQLFQTDSLANESFLKIRVSKDLVL